MKASSSRENIFFKIIYIYIYIYVNIIINDNLKLDFSYYNILYVKELRFSMNCITIEDTSCTYSHGLPNKLAVPLWTNDKGYEMIPGALHRPYGLGKSRKTQLGVHLMKVVRP